MSSKPEWKIVSIDGSVRLLKEDIEVLQGFGEVTVYHDRPNDDEAKRRITDANVVIFDWYPMLATTIAAATKLAIICVAGTGYQGRVDLEECRRRNITVCNAPDYATDSVAEHTIGLMLNAARWISIADQDIRQHQWNPDKYEGIELRGKTLGIIGYGRIGRRVAEIATTGIGMDIITVNSKSPKQEFETLLKQSDVISLHVPINEKTSGMLGKREFEMIKPGVILINTSRGEVVDIGVLIQNLKSGKVFAAGLDVFPKEPLPANHLLDHFTNVILTPHIASSTKEAKAKISQTIKENIVNFIEGHPINVV